MSVFRQLSDLAAAALQTSSVEQPSHLNKHAASLMTGGELAAAAAPSAFNARAGPGAAWRPGGNAHDEASAAYPETVSGGAATHQEASRSTPPDS